MKNNRKIVFLLLALVLMVTFPMTSSAAETQTVLFPKIQSRTEQTGYIYKLMNGKQYKRLWSYTYGR